MGAGITFTQVELNRVLALHERFLALQGGSRAKLKDTNLDGLNLANRNLQEIDFSGASMVGANLFGSNLTRTRLYGADLRRSDLRNANLTGSDMRGASLNGANLSHAKLDNADMRSVIMMKMGPDGLLLVDRADSLGGKGAGKRVGVDFSNCSMKCVSFGNAQLDGADFSGAVLEGAKFVGAKLVNVTFRGAVLTGVNLKDLCVPPEALEGCILDVSAHALARAASLKAGLETHQKWIASGGKEGAPAVLDGEDLRPLRKLFTGRQLTALSARNAIAVGIDFSGCQLQGAKFDGSDLREANFSQADLAGTSFKAAKLAHASFHKANLSKLNLLSGASVVPDMTGTQTVKSQFDGAVLDKAISDLFAGAPAEASPTLKSVRL